MSGGSFDYSQYRIEEIANIIEDYIYGHEIDEENIQDYINEHYLEEDELNYIRKHKHTIPNRYKYDKKTIKEFKKGLAILRKAYIYVQRIDWLLSGDDGEISFHERLQEEIEKLKNKDNIK